MLQSSPIASSTIGSCGSDGVPSSASAVIEAVAWLAYSRHSPATAPVNWILATIFPSTVSTSPSIGSQLRSSIVSNTSETAESSRFTASSCTLVTLTSSASKFEIQQRSTNQLCRSQQRQHTNLHLLRGKRLADVTLSARGNGP